jgi:hypothetical protein
MRPRAYSLLMVLMLLGLLGIAVGGLMATIVSGAQTSGNMIERRRTFYACDGMGRQLAALGQAFLSRNTLEDVPESQMQAELRAFLPRITPPGFESAPEDLVIPEKVLSDPQPTEMITTGPFSGLQVKLQTIDMRFEARRTASGAVCRAEQTLSLGRIALFQFFSFADLPLLEISPPQGDVVLLQGRMHTNGRTCLGGDANANGAVSGSHAVRIDGRVTAVDRIHHAADVRCGFGGGDVGILGARAAGAQVLGQPDRLLNDRLLDPLTLGGQSACTESRDCRGGWRSFALGRWLGRVQDRDHEVQELTLPVDPPVRFTQLGWAADGRTFLQQMTASSSRPNNRFLVEPVLATRDPPGFSRNKMADKAQIRIIDGVWYVKDPGANNDIAETDDDGPWPGIPIWSDHPGEYTTNTPEMTAEGVEGAAPLSVGQSDIRNALKKSTDPRLKNAKWDKRMDIGASPTPRRFSHYAFVDRSQAQAAGTALNPPGMGLQFGRVRRCNGSGNCQGLDVDPPAVVSYGAIAPFSLSGEQPYWVPGVRFTDARFDFERRDGNGPTPGFCGGTSDFSATRFIDPVRHNAIHPSVPRPIQRFESTTSEGGTVVTFRDVDFPSPNSPLPSDGTGVAYAPGTDGWERGGVCRSSSDLDFRHRMRIALLEGTRSGFRDTNHHSNTAFANAAPSQPDVLPMNFNLHALQEAIADKTPGELGSYFCEDCLWKTFNGTIYVTNTWRGSMLGVSFPDGRASPPPSPLVDDIGIAGVTPQPRIPREDLSTTGPLPYTLCAAHSDESSNALAQVVGHRFLEADELQRANGDLQTGFVMPFAGNVAGGRMHRNIVVPPRSSLTPTESGPQPSDLVTPPTGGLKGTFIIPECKAYSTVSGPLAGVRPTALRLINGRTLNFNATKCGPDRNQRCQPMLSEGGGGDAERATGVIAEGLNIIANVPIYVVGDMNNASEIDAVQTGQKATDWIPFMVAGDTITTLSNGWSDHGSRWRVNPADFGMSVEVGRSPRVALSTTYNMLLLTGLPGGGVFAAPGVVEPIPQTSGGLLGGMRLMEDWRAAQHRFRGSIVLGWMPVYTQWRVDRPGARSYAPPALRDWRFDRHLNATVNQPPDSPVFDVTALRSWRRE